ncbi:MAG: GatB/YqeY domain-containing protein [Salaquimonas sp.]
MRDKLADALKEAQKALEKKRVSTLRLINAAIQDRDIALRGKGKDKADDEEVLDILGKMVKQREESSKMYIEGGRLELADQELEETAIIKEFMPEQLSEDAVQAIVTEVIAETGATSLRDMGKVMGILKERYRGQLDMGVAGGMIKSQLSG